MGKDSPSLNEVAAFLEAAEARGSREHALACLLALNGLTVASVCGARASDLAGEPGARTLSVSLTGGRPTLIPLNPRTASAIEDHLDGRTAGPLLLGADEGPLDRREAISIVRAITRAAGLGYRLGQH